MASPQSPKQLGPATALATRTTENVIADLKRPIHDPNAGPYKHQRDFLSSTNIPELKPIEVNSQQIEQLPIANDAVSEDEQEDYDDDEDEEDVTPSTKPRKITERKRRQNAAANSYFQKFLNNSIKNHEVKAEHVAYQSAKWLINQSNKDAVPIISTPRAYQSELFERAKEKNIIAVLDTGKSDPILWFQAYLRRVWQNFDCSSSSSSYLQPGARG
jgi:endoribonuclease Dicer